MADAKERLYLWLDLETTGDRPTFDDILEVGWFITNEDLAIQHGGENSIVQPADHLWQNKMIPIVKEMHEKSGLTADLQRNIHHDDLWMVESRIIAALHEVDPHMVCDWVLAGSGVAGFDLQFIKSKMDALSNLLTYFVIDVGQWRRFLRDICDVPMEGISEELAESRAITHRAYDDIRNHHTEALLYRELIQRFVHPPTLFTKTGE